MRFVLNQIRITEDHLCIKSEKISLLKIWLDLKTIKSLQIIRNKKSNRIYVKSKFNQ